MLYIVLNLDTVHDPAFLQVLEMHVKGRAFPMRGQRAVERKTGLAIPDDAPKFEALHAIPSIGLLLSHSSTGLM